MTVEKVIVINDTDGHTTVLRWPKENLSRMLRAFIESAPEIDDEYPVAFLTAKPEVDEIDTFLRDKVHEVNARNGCCHANSIFPPT